MALVDQNTYVEPTAGTSLSTARLQQNRSYRSVLANFSSNVAPSLTAINMSVDGAAITPPDGSLFYLANVNNSTLYVHDGTRTMVDSTHPLTGTKYTRMGIVRAEKSYQSLKDNVAAYEQGETVATLDSANARLYLAAANSANMGKFVDVGIPPKTRAVSNIMIGTGDAGNDCGVTKENMNLTSAYNTGDAVADRRYTLELRSHALLDSSTTYGGNVSLGFNTNNSAANASIVFYGAGTGANIGTKSGFRFVDKTQKDLVPIAANTMLQSITGPTSTTAASQTTAPLIPVGSLIMWSHNSTPGGWLICDGAAVNRTTYAGLFALIGDEWGEGNGTTTFNVPNFQDRLPLGANVNSGQGNQIYAKTTEVVAASASLAVASGSAALSNTTVSVAQSAKDSSTVAVVSGISAGGHTHTAKLPTNTVHFIIKT